jgi:hypothetical protein
MPSPSMEESDVGITTINRLALVRRALSDFRQVEFGGLPVSSQHPPPILGWNIAACGRGAGVFVPTVARWPRAMRSRTR